MVNKKIPPSVEERLREAKVDPAPSKIGMFLPIMGWFAKPIKRKFARGLMMVRR